MKIHLPYNGGVTLIENTFIDRYMPAANGEFVKIYLYLLRCASSGISDLSISGIADVFDHTEADVRRALNYWVKVKLIELNCDEDGSLKDVRLLHPAGQALKAQPLLMICSCPGRILCFRQPPLPLMRLQQNLKSRNSVRPFPAERGKRQSGGATSRGSCSLRSSITDGRWQRRRKKTWSISWIRSG